MKTDDANRNDRSGGARTRSKSSFTLIELLVVIGIIALLAGFVVGGTRYASTKMKENRIRAELQQLVTAIEAYKARYNQYPPDNFVNGVANPVTNQLFYELTGVLVDEQNRFYLPGRQQRFVSGTVQTFFHTDGFVNAGNNPKEIKQFAAFKSEQHRTIATMPADIEVLRVPVDWPPSDPQAPFGAITDPNVKRINPWRYVGHGHATNNPDGIDLWAEYKDGGKVKIICNWSKDVLEK